MPRIRLRFGEMVISASVIREKRMTPERMAALNAAIEQVTEDMMKEADLRLVEIQQCGTFDLSSPNDLRATAEEIRDHLRGVERDHPDEGDAA